MLFNLEKRHRYFIYSISISILVYVFSFVSSTDKVTIAFLLFLLVLVGTFVTQYPNVTVKNFFLLLIIPISLISGMLLTLIYFPNLGLVIKIAIAGVSAALLYISSLINNIFIVVAEKREIIPLYRVASIWELILLNVTAIPLFAGIFKLPLNNFIQNGLVGLASTILLIYLIWVIRFDPDSRQVEIGELVFIVVYSVFLTIVAGVAVSILPSESFLRALFVSSVFMFSVNYLQGHIKNSINLSILTEYFLLSSITFFLLVSFKP